MSVGSVTLDNPPANSYDLAVMQKFAADVDAAIASDARVVIVRSANEKFFSAGADVKKFLAGDVEANMAMIRTSQAAFKQMAAAEQVVIASASLPRARTSSAPRRSRSGCCPATAAHSA
jgi:enoyl-CoA hydratase/carnithine racemase